MPPAALILTFGPTCSLNSFTSSSVAPPVPKPVEVLIKSAFAFVTHLQISIFSSSLLELAISHHLYWMKYLPNFTWQFSSYLFGKLSGLEGLDFWFSCIWYSLYFVIFLLLIRGIFKRKDIKNV